MRPGVSFPEVYGEPVYVDNLFDTEVYGEWFADDAFGGTFTIDAVLRAERSGSFTVDAILRVPRAGSFTLDAEFVAARLFTLDAVLRAERSGSVTADSILRVARAGTLTADAWLRLRATGSFTADAVKKRTITGTFTENAIKRKTQTGSKTADAILRKTQAATLALDAELAFHRTGSLTADAVLHVGQSDSFVLRACIRNDEADVASSTGVTQVHIRVDGVDITDDVIFSDATFTTLVNGAPGTFRFRVKDTDRTRSCTTGQEVTLDINGIRRFGGYLSTPNRAFFFPVEDTVTDITRVARVLTFTGVDYNIVFAKRVVYDKANPADIELREWPEDTQDDTIIKWAFDHYTDLADDGFTHDRVDHVGFPNPDRKGTVASGGLYFGDFMREVNRLIGAVWYISPDKDLTFADVDVPNASKSLSDNPAGGTQIGYREFTHMGTATKMANDALVWGAAQGASRMVFGRNTDAASVAAHGLWQFGEFSTQMYKQASVNARSDSIVDGTPQSKRGGKDPQISWSVVTYDTAFVVGQKVSIESEVYGKSDVVPIRRMTITFPTKTDPKFEMVLSHEIDEPWNIFESFFPSFDFDIPIIDIDIDIDISDPPPVICWTIPPSGVLDDFIRGPLVPDPVNPDQRSNVGFTSHGGYPWLDDGSDATLTQTLSGVLRTQLPGPEYDPVLGTGVSVGTAERRVWLPIDTNKVRIEFTLLLSMNAYDPFIVGGSASTVDISFGLDRYDAGGLWDPSTFSRIQQYGVFFEIRNDGDEFVGVPHLYVQFMDHPEFDMGAVGATSSLVSAGPYGFVFEIDGDNVSMILGAHVDSDVYPRIAVAEDGANGYAKLILDAGSLNGEQYISQFAANSGFVTQISNLKVTSDLGTCVQVPPYTGNPDYDGS